MEDPENPKHFPEIETHLNASRSPMSNDIKKLYLLRQQGTGIKIRNICHWTISGSQQTNLNILTVNKFLKRLGTVAHICNPNILGGHSKWTT